MGHDTDHSVFGWPTWTLNPHLLLANPFPHRWGAQHLSLTPTGISFLQIPTQTLPATSPWRPYIPPQPYFLIEADPDENTNTWDTRTWVNHHPLDTPPEHYLLALTVHAATTKPSHTTTIGPVSNNDDTWETVWRNHTRNSLPHPALMVHYQFHQHARNLTTELEHATRAH